MASPVGLRAHRGLLGAIDYIESSAASLAPLRGYSKSRGYIGSHRSCHLPRSTARAARSLATRLHPEPRLRTFSSSSLSRVASSSPSSSQPSTGKHQTVTLLGQTYETDDYTNVPPSILSRLGPRPMLPYQDCHPLQLLRTQIESNLWRCEALAAPSPVVSSTANFDDLGIAPDHPGRSPTDTYYLNRSTCLRTHTSAHEVQTFKQGISRWLLTADVYRRDEIDSSHYPIFHQMEGASVWSTAPDSTDFSEGGLVQRECEEMEARLQGAEIVIEDQVSLDEAGGWQQGHQADPVRRRAAALSLRHLKATLNSLAFDLFSERHAADVASAATMSQSKSNATEGVAPKSEGSAGEVNDPLRVRWIPAFFPFTSPSFEVEVWFRGQWLEILGCGIVQQRTLDRAAVQDCLGWAFGLGLERIAMVLYSVPDIRLFWSKDERFLKQFRGSGLPEQTKVSKADSPQAGVSSAGGNVVQKARRLVTFRPYSKFPSCHKDVSFWLPVPEKDASPARSPPPPPASSPSAPPPTSASFHENDLMEIIRDTAADLAEEVKLIDSFRHPKTGRESRCYRVNYRSMERSLENEEVNALHEKVVQRVRDELRVQIR